MNEKAFRLAADILAELPRLLREARSARQIGCREAGEEIGISAPVVSRIERGADCSAYTARLILRWLGTEKEKEGPVTNADMVAEFHTATRTPAAPHPTAHPGSERLALRRSLILEEFREYRVETKPGSDTSRTLKELCDLLYVVYGTALTHGFTPAQIDAAFAEVHRSNMTKVDGMVTRPDGKVLKGPNYQPADIAAVLEAS